MIDLKSEMIDLRSDTLTTPCSEMRQAIANAAVGDDVFSEDPTVNELEAYTAELLGKEAALYVPSGTMSNQLALKVLTDPGDEIIVEKEAHIFQYETAAPAIISNIQVNCIPSEKGMPLIEDIEEAIRPDIYYYPKTKVVCLENTHNRHGGSIIDLDYIKKLAILVKSKGLKYHCDGARIWNACVATGISPKEYAEDFDTISVCLSKGLGAPIGSVLLSSTENIEKARHWRKILGGGMRQAGLLAAAGLFALKNNFEKLADDHKNAKLFAEKIANIERITCDPAKVETNIVMFDIDETIDAQQLSDECQRAGLSIIQFGPKRFRCVFYLDISTEEAIRASGILKNVVDNFS
jgi:threonine aldolase